MLTFLATLSWWIPAAIALVGVVLFLSGNKRQERPMMYAGLGALLLAIVLVLVGWLVDTDVKRVERRSRQLVEAIGRKDWPVAQSLLGPKVSFGPYHNRAQLIAGAQAAAQVFGLKSASLWSLESQQTDTLITVTFTAATVQEATQDRPIRSRWQLDWQETADGWSLMTIKILDVDGQSPDQAIRRLPVVSQTE